MFFEFPYRHLKGYRLLEVGPQKLAGMLEEIVPCLALI
jgi:hypothetical protein